MKKLILTLTVIFSVATVSIACDGDKKETKKCCSKKDKKACAGESAKACASKGEATSCKKAAKGACCKSKMATVEAAPAPAPAEK